MGDDGDRYRRARRASAHQLGEEGTDGDAPDATPRAPGRRTRVMTRYGRKPPRSVPRWPGKRTRSELVTLAPQNFAYVTGDVGRTIREARGHLARLEHAVAAGDSSMIADAAVAIRRCLAAATRVLTRMAADLPHDLDRILAEISEAAEALLGGMASKPVEACHVEAQPTSPQTVDSSTRPEAPPVELQPARTPDKIPFRHELEQIFGTSFAGVQAYLHEGDALARHGARAAAWREGVAFAASPSMPLVAHELAHVVQLRHAAAIGATSRRDDATERDADAIAHAVARGARAVSVRPVPGPAALAFSPDDGPVAAGAAPSPLGGVVSESVERAQRDRISLGVAFGQSAVLGAAINSAAHGRDTTVMRDAMVAAAMRIGRLATSVQLAGQRGSTAITVDDLLKLLADVYLGAELETYGLPRSFGNELVLDSIVSEISSALDDALAVIGAASPAAAVAARIDEHAPAITAAIEGAVSQWDDPMDLVELELKGAIGKLTALRGELIKAKTPAQRRAFGGQIAHLARYVLLLDHKLGDVDQRIVRQRKPGTPAGLNQLLDAGVALGDARALVGSEQRSLEALGNKAALLGEHKIAAVDPGAQTTVSEATVAPEEAFAHHTDDLAASAQEQIAAHSARQERELRELHDQLVPKQIATRAAFRVLYERWFGFFSRVERDDQSGSLMALYEGVAEILPMSGAQGILVRQALQRTFATGGLPLRGVSDEFGAEIGKVPLERNVVTHDVATRGGDAGVDYQFAGVRAGDRGAGVESERASRRTTVGDRVGQRKRAMDEVYAAPDATGRDRAAVANGLAPPPELGRGLEMSLYGGKDYRLGRDGADSGWNYLLAAQVGWATGQLKTVYEHKAMRREVAAYLLAVAQHLHTLEKPHTIADARGRRLGDAAARKNIEASTASASELYGDPRDRGAARSAGARAELAAARKRAGLATNAPGGRLKEAAQQLARDLEAGMDRYFASASAGDRLAAVILDLGVTEYQLDVTVWSHFEPAALWEFARTAIEMAALFWALHSMGPFGQLAATVIQKALYREDGRQLIAAAVALAAWLEGASSVTSFREARGWAFMFRSLADILVQTLRDWLATRTGHAVADRLGEKWKPGRQDPKTVGGLRDQLGPVFDGDPKARADLGQRLGAEIDRRMVHGKPMPAELEPAWALLNAIDPAAARALRSKHPELPALTGASPLHAGTTTSQHTPLHLKGAERAVRAELDRHLNSAQTIADYRVEVLPPADYARRFQSEKGRSSVMVLENGVAVVYARADYRPSDLADEAMHLRQLNDPKAGRIAESIRMLSEPTVGRWDQMDLEMRKHLFERKLEVEIDAKQRRLAELRAGTQDWKAVNDQLKDLRALEAKSHAITPEQLQLMKAVPSRAPDFLRDPAFLFAKETTIYGIDPRQLAPLDAAKLPLTVVHDSPAGKIAGNKVSQIGAPWTEVTVVTANYTGKASYDPSTPDRVHIGDRVYVFENGATVHVADRNGQIIAAGTPLATEPPQRYRLVRVEARDGGTTERLEYHSTKRRGWVQAGEHSSKRGAIIEEAARRQITAELEAAKRHAHDPNHPDSKKADRLVDYVRLPHQNAHGHGFDDVIVEFRGDPPVAKIRIIEVKDYPNRNLRMEEMSALRENRKANFKRLRTDIENALMVAPGKRPRGYERLSNQQLLALQIAAKDHHIEIELRLSESTLIGDESRATSLLRKLRTELMASDDFGGKDVLARTPMRIDPKYVDEVATAEPSETLTQDKGTSR